MALFRKARKVQYGQREQQRWSRPKRAKKGNIKKWILRVSLSMIFLLVFAGPVVAALKAPFLNISKVTVTGNQQVDENIILSGLDLLDKNIVSLDTKLIIQSIENIPLIKNVTVSRQLPDEIIINVEERQPWAIWQAGNSKYIIDDEGVVLGNAPAQSPLIVITDMEKKGLFPGNRVDPQAVQLAQRLTDVLPREIGAKAKKFEYVERGGLVVETDKGWRARFGDASDFDFKMATWKAILDKAKQDKLKVQHVDLRFGTRPFFR